MEKEGFIRCVDNLIDNFETDVRLISTDRHCQIRKLMRVSYDGIIHQFDPWHIAKVISKKLVKASKRKGMYI